MKKVKLILITGAVIFFTACSSGSGGHRDPIDRNVELTVDSTRELSIPCTINASEFAGKNAFVVIQNNSPTDIENIMNSNMQNDKYNEIIKNYKINLRNNGLYENIPYSVPEILPLLKNSATRTRSSFISRTDNTFATTIPESGLTVNNSQHDFYAFKTDETISETYAHGAVLKALGTHCNVWYKEKTGININNDNIFQSLANNFDSIYEKETYIFGSNKITVSNNNLVTSTATKPKVNILVYDLFDDYLQTKEDNAGTFGYFTYIDLVRNTTLQANTRTSNLKSNECQCVHIDSYFLSVSAAQVYSTLGHEFQHLLNFVNKTANNLSDADSPLSDSSHSETWFNEMMSMVCEDIMLTQLNLPVYAGPQSRLDIFNQSYYYGFNLWYPSDDERVYISYANAYAFGAYLLRNYGIDAIRNIATNSYNNEAAISHGVGVGFDTLFKNFYNVILNPKASNYTLNKPVSAIYTINGSSVTFNCAAINLFDYQTLEASEIDYNTVKYIYQAEINQNYYGPIIFRNTVDSVGPRGTWVMNINGSVALDNSFNTGLKYYLVITQ